ncbi:Klumpfuss [Aphelenchoides besseyi]|nr:Klumpfuss [Aphelenchoides besseyi]KAI6208524.1 Klumpfuss [Aphelenchoides besseyi]
MLQLPKPSPQRPTQLQLDLPTFSIPVERPGTPPIAPIAFKLTDQRSQELTLDMPAQSAQQPHLKTPPLIFEQCPSAPSSPTSPSSRSKRPSPINVDALQRFDLLSPNYVPSTMESNKLSPLSPSYPTSDLGSSPRSSISISNSMLGPNWTAFRDYKKASSDYDAESMCGKDGFLSPGTALSPAPFSPFSDCIDLPETPYSRSPNLSPGPMHHQTRFSFDQIRSRSSMSSRPEAQEQARLLMPQTSLDLDARERSRSEGEMLKKEDDEMMDTINHSTVSVPVSSAGQYKKRLLQKYRQEQQLKASFHSTISSNGDDCSTIGGGNSINQLSVDPEDPGNSVSAQVSRQPTIEEPPLSPTFNEILHSNDLNVERQRQIEEWIKQQAIALEAFRNTMLPMQQEANLLQVPNVHGAPPAAEQHLPRSLVRMFSNNSTAAPGVDAPGPLKNTLWRRSRSESDVSVPQTETSFICEHCGQGFSMHDRLAKHIASRHRDRSASVNDESTKTHKCTVCSRAFGRSDMLSRHLRLHTGVKPYSCQICGQVFSRSDHLSTHQRTHTGEKPYRCPVCNYSASRRDMISRHMRTHLRPDGTPMPFTEVQLPIAQLSIKPTTPEPPRNSTPPPAVAPNFTALLQNAAAVRPHVSPHPPALGTIGLVNPPNPDTTLEAAARIFHAAANGSITPQMMLNTLGHSLDTQVHQFGFRRSTPNIFQSLENTPNSAAAMNATISRLLAPPSLGSPALSRQSSIGGFGFSDQPSPNF